jgi:hypothetical protein
MTEIQRFEKQLLEEGESVSLIYKIAYAYSNVGDATTAKLYLDYLEALLTTNKVNDSRILDAVEKLKQKIANQKQRQPTGKKASPHSLLQFNTGYKTNANNGTNLEYLNFSLTSGEVYVIDINPESQQVSSGYVSALFMHNQNLKWPDVVLHTAIEATQYEKPLGPNNYMLRSGLNWKNHTLTAYLYNNNESITGLLYSGHSDHFNWSYRLQNDRSIGRIGVSYLLKQKQSLQRFNLSASRDTPADVRSGGVSDYYQFRYQLITNSVRLNYKYEYGQDSDIYNSVFFPGVIDRYDWHSISLEKVLAKYKNQQFSLKAGYDIKTNKIELNSWEGWNINLATTLVF